MAALKIQYKLFVAMFAWSAILIAVLAFSIQKSLDFGMIDYVNQKEVDNMKPFIERLKEAYRREGSWSSFEERTGRFKRMLHQQLWETGTGPETGPHMPRHGRPGRRPPPGSDDFYPRGPQSAAPPPDDEAPFGRPSYGRSPAQEGRNNIAQASHPPGSDRPNRPPHMRSQDGPPNDNRRSGPTISYVLLDKDKKLIAGFYPPDREYTFVELTLPATNDSAVEETVGYFAVSKRSSLAEGYELKFLDKQQEQLFTIGSLLLLMTFALTLPFARHLVRPIKLVASSLSQLSKGQYDTELSTSRSDEFQLLFQNINNLAKTLAENETARKKWFADTAHDLRTPIAIMRGELEAMLDGVRKMDTNQIESVHSETLRLQRFINDLHELARSELGTQHYQKASVDLNDVILDTAHHCQQLLAKQDIQLLTHVPDSETLFFADEFRLAQCLDNLLTNIANYAHNAKNARITMTRTERGISIIVEDDGVGVSAEHLDKLFDHLYRVEGSRNRGSLDNNAGGSGLGLAICKNIISAHNGNIQAEKSTLGGLAIVINLPV